MKWFYAKDGQQTGPVEFDEIKRLHAEGYLSGESLVWQQGTAGWVPLSTVLGPTPASPEEPPPAPIPPLSIPSAGAEIASPASSRAPLPDYGDYLCWGILAILLPCVGWVAYIALIVLHVMEYTAARNAVEEGRLAASDYSRVNPVLFVLGLICCGVIFYPLFMHYRNKSGYFKLQPYAVHVAILAVVLAIGLNVILNLGMAWFQQSVPSSFGS